MVAMLTIGIFSSVLSSDDMITLQKAEGRTEGRREAERDIATNTMKLKIYGYLAGYERGHETYVRRMRDRLSVEVVVVGQCILTSREKGLWDGYNERIEEELERRHGAGVLAMVGQEAAAQWQVRRVLVVAIAVVGFVRIFRWFVKRPSKAVAG